MENKKNIITIVLSLIIGIAIGATGMYMYTSSQKPKMPMDNINRPGGMSKELPEGMSEEEFLEMREQRKTESSS